METILARTTNYPPNCCSWKNLPMTWNICKLEHTQTSGQHVMNSPLPKSGICLFATSLYAQNRLNDPNVAKNKFITYI